MRRKMESVLSFESSDDGLPKVLRDYRARSPEVLVPQAAVPFGTSTFSPEDGCPLFYSPLEWLMNGRNVFPRAWLAHDDG
jgi:hypothetical protein